MITIEENPSCFFTQQVFLIGTRNEDGAANFAPISWISYVYGPPTCLVISMMTAKQTFRNIERTGLLSATVLTPDLLPFAECCNNHTKNEALYERVKPQFESGQILDVPLITGAKWTYECEVINTVKLGESATFFAKIRQVHLAPEVAALDFYDLRAINPVVYSPNNYFTVGEHLGEIGDYSKKE
jgi:flavin reductase (DIM6/NTAB) family NADH-FMN oxidoreductase RutF